MSAEPGDPTSVGIDGPRPATPSRKPWVAPRVIVSALSFSSTGSHPKAPKEPVTPATANRNSSPTS